MERECTQDSLSNEFDIIGNLGCYAPDGYSLVGAIYVNGKKLFKRIAIKKKG
jgi:hypothetical protein